MNHDVPSNDLGIFAMHSRGGRKLSSEEILALINGPCKAVQEKLNEALQTENQAHSIRTDIPENDLGVFAVASDGPLSDATLKALNAPDGITAAGIENMKASEGAEPDQRPPELVENPVAVVLDRIGYVEPSGPSESDILDEISMSQADADAKLLHEYIDGLEPEGSLDMAELEAAASKLCGSKFFCLHVWLLIWCDRLRLTQALYWVKGLLHLNEE